MKKHLRSLLIILVVFLACTTLFGCSGKRYYQYTGASMNTYEGLVTTLKQEVEEGDIFVLQSPASTIREEKDGSATKFVGWKIKGEDKIYSPGEQLTMGSKNIHLQAVWKNAYKLNFVNNDQTATGNLPAMNDYYAVGEAVVLPECKLEKTDYSFGGWKYSSDNKIYQAGETFTMPDQAVTFTTTWTNVYNLTFLSGAENDQQITGDAPFLAPREIGAQVFLPACTFSYAGYEFVCWLSNGVEYAVGESYTVTGHTTFTAKWQKSTVTSTENFNFTLLENNTYAIAKSSTFSASKTANLILPATFNDLPVSVIKANAFASTSIESVQIPASITVIEDNAFASCTKLFSVIFEENSQLTEIGESAFVNCSRLATFGYENTTKNSAIMPDALTEIDDKAFMNCAFRKITLNASLQELGNGVFAKQQYLTEFVSNSQNFKGGEFLTDAQDNNLYAFAYACQNAKTISINVTNILPYSFSNSSIETLNIGANVKEIGEHAFEYCYSLKTINYDENNALTTIEEYAFLACSALTVANIGKTVTDFSVSAFEGCTQIREFVVHEENAYFASYGGNLYNKAKTVFLACAINNESGNCFLPATVTTIAEKAFAYSKVVEVFIHNENPDHKIQISDKAFYSCDFLKTLSFWDKITTIGDGAFEYCSAIDNAVLGNSLVELGEYAFYYCEKLATISISDKCPLTYISKNAFANCALTDFDARGKIQTIEQNAFASCASMTSVKLNGVLEIAYGAFASCTNLKKVEIPASLNTLAGGAFNNAYAALTFTVAEGSVNFSAQDGSLYNADKTTLVVASRATANGAYVLPSTVKTIAPYAFYNTEITSLDASNSALESIESYAFASCANLISVKVPASLKYIRSYAFAQSLLLATFEFVDTEGNRTQQQLARIEEYAFKNCIRLKLYMLGENLPFIDVNAFYLEPSAQASSNKPRIFVDANMLEEIKVRFPTIASYLQTSEE